VIATARASTFDLLGFAVLPGVVGIDRVESLGRAIDAAGAGENVLRRDGTLYGMRDALRGLPEVRELANSAEILGLVRPILGPDAFVVRALLFDKTPGANWGVPWHQDLTIAVKQRVKTDGFGPWTVKAGIPHVRPPIEVLEGMVTVRVHLDDCDATSGPLRILPGSHNHGRLGAEATRLWLERDRPIECLVGAGGAVLIRPLLLHASSPATSPRRRRVVHLEYAAAGLPGGLEWFESGTEPPR
jgi:ectoine hydroxylase-related dioxygenase (phytanoyl-CoA dioxygenase family)